MNGVNSQSCPTRYEPEAQGKIPMRNEPGGGSGAGGGRLAGKLGERGVSTIDVGLVWRRGSRLREEVQEFIAIAREPMAGGVGGELPRRPQSLRARWCHMNA